MHNFKGVDMYQPVPFDSYAGKSHVRGDCGERWDCIRGFLPEDITDFSFLDYGCAEGYFLWRALKDGAKKAVFSDFDLACLDVCKNIASDQGYFHKCEFIKGMPEKSVDVCFYLDVHYNDKTPSLKEFKDKCSLLFISPSGDGGKNSRNLFLELIEVFDSVMPIYEGYVDRVIFMCS